MSEILNFFSFIIFFTTATNIHSDTALQLTRSERLSCDLRIPSAQAQIHSMEPVLRAKNVTIIKEQHPVLVLMDLEPVVLVKCGSVTTLNNTYFVNPGYYSSYEGGERCTITVYRCNSDVCQLRIDFMEFNLAQPNASGVCDNDFLLISGSASTVPRICGENNNQHVYVDFNGANPITISVDTNTDYAFARKWNLRLRQIACDSPWRAPNGCLQYYKTITGTVTSFNYGTTTNSRVSTPLLIPGTRQMQNLNYGVCIRMALGYCTIEWSQSDTLSFTVSGDSGILDGTPGIDYSVSGELCTHNFVIVPNPSANGSRDTTDRFCGNGFQTKQSSSKPFVLYVVTNQDPNENQAATDDFVERDFANRGFVLKYRQLACAV